MKIISAKARNTTEARPCKQKKEKNETIENFWLRIAEWKKKSKANCAGRRVGKAEKGFFISFPCFVKYRLTQGAHHDSPIDARDGKINWKIKIFLLFVARWGKTLKIGKNKKKREETLLGMKKMFIKRKNWTSQLGNSSFVISSKKKQEFQQKKSFPPSSAKKSEGDGSGSCRKNARSSFSVKKTFHLVFLWF